MMRRIVQTLLTLTISVLPTALTAQEIVASTSWTAAFLYTAGAEQVTVLAPYEMTHPAEYVLRPSDIVSLAEADIVVYAGYEIMVERLLDAVSSSAVVVPIATVHDYATIEASVLKLAAAMGTEDAAGANLQLIRNFLAQWRAELEEVLPIEANAAVHVHQRALAEELGLQIAAVFGPGPLSARQIDDISTLRPDVIIDNIHNPVAIALRETTDALIAEWRNFPGANGERTVLDILISNRETTRAQFLLR